MEFVNAVLDSIARDRTRQHRRDGRAVENALARALPLVIGFLARLLGLGGIRDKIRSIIETVRAGQEGRRLDRAEGGQGLQEAMAWAKGKVARPKEWAKGKVEAGKEKLSSLDPRKRKRKHDEPQTPARRRPRRPS